jgi:HPr kinase/phosphorylase
MTNAPGQAPQTVHATVLLVGPVGVMIRGRSGAGKSALADAVIGEAEARGAFAALVADDRVIVTAQGGRLVARPPAQLAGLIERRGLGVMAINHEPAAVVAGVVELTDDPVERVPPIERTVVVEGVRLPVLEIQAGDPRAARLVAFFARMLAAR